MTPRIVKSTELKIVGYPMQMSLADNRTRELWQRFMKSRKEITNASSSFLYSVNIYNDSYFENFSPANEFTKWAGTEVTDFNHVPAGMQTLTIPAGNYAVFTHRGPASTGAKTFQYIFAVWFPTSDYLPDERPHFELLGEKYKNEESDSEEEIWIPIRSRA